jgi:hypothetical protein
LAGASTAKLSPVYTPFSIEFVAYWQIFWNQIHDASKKRSAGTMDCEMEQKSLSSRNFGETFRMWLTNTRQEAFGFSPNHHFQHNSLFTKFL